MIEISLAHGRRMKLMTAANQPPSFIALDCCKNLDLLEQTAGIEPATF